MLPLPSGWASMTRYHDQHRRRKRFSPWRFDIERPERGTLELACAMCVLLSVEGRTSRPAPLGGRREECWRSVEFGMS